MPTTTIIPVLAACRHPRVRYVLKEISRDLGYRFQLFTDELKWVAANSPFKLTYGVEARIGSAPSIPAHPFMEGRSHLRDGLTVRFDDDIPTFFHCPTASQSKFTFDPLACIFFCLSRYEEYGDNEWDGHGRFPGRASHAARNGYLHVPVVRSWAMMIGQLLREAYPSIPQLQRHPFYFQPTYDIDLLWAYRYRGLKGLASGARDAFTGKTGRALIRIKTGEQDDPYNILEYLIDLQSSRAAGEGKESGTSERRREVTPYIFWLLADNKNRHDVNPYPIPSGQTAQMRKTAGSATHGLHPSYRTMDRPELIEDEAVRFQRIMGRMPTHGRQHFLRFRLPETYRSLLLSGIRNDHSMGYADVSGWRAGTNLPFYWYDLEKEEVTGLLIHPFAAMEVTLKNYENLSPADAKKRILALANAIHQVGGPFALLWHNSSFAAEHGWEGWGEIYEQIVKALHRLEGER